MTNAYVMKISYSMAKLSNITNYFRSNTDIFAWILPSVLILLFV